MLSFSFLVFPRMLETGHGTVSHFAASPPCLLKSAVGYLPQMIKGGVGQELGELGASAFRTLHEAQRLEEYRNGCLGNQRVSMGTQKRLRLWPLHACRPMLCNIGT